MKNNLPTEPESFRVPPSVCPFCEKKLDGVTEVKRGADSAREEGSAPQPGDFTICPECASICVFNEQIHLAVPNKDQMADLIQSPIYPPMVVAAISIKLGIPPDAEVSIRVIHQDPPTNEN